MYNEVETKGATAVTSGGCSCGFILFIVFLILKLTNVIDWSWFWVVFPLWIGPAVVLSIALIIGIIALIVSCVSKRRY
jgi:hypothetical protein